MAILSNSRLILTVHSTCRKAVKPESIAALAGRNIVKSEMLVFDTAHRRLDNPGEPEAVARAEVLVVAPNR
jgi:hypothetical protein